MIKLSVPLAAAAGLAVNELGQSVLDVCGWGNQPGSGCAELRTLININAKTHLNRA